ncbi:MAG: membrane protein of unknown function [Promethearchaeota archaeon]|nr:MAG: membrane protein of unknown function [Candidatus Lokiarchaeota archaeon]
MRLTKPDLYFVLILSGGLLLRIFTLIGIDIEPDSYTYLEGTITLINLDYNSIRPPGFPLLIVPFYLLTGNGKISIKLTSFVFSILGLICSYFIFTNASHNLHKRHSKKDSIRSKYVGLLVSFFLAFNLYLVNNSGRGLREEIMMVICMFVFYIVVVKEKHVLRDNLSLALLIALLSLTHLTAGMFLTLGMVLYSILSRLKRFRFTPLSLKSLLLIIVSFLITFFLWAIYSNFQFGDPFYNWHNHGNTFKIKYNIDLSTLENILKAFINAIIFGIPSELIYLGALSSFVFIGMAIYLVLKNLKQKQFLFIFLTVGVSFAYLSIFMTIPRVLLYLLPFIFYLGAISIGFTMNEFKDLKTPFQKKMIYLLVLFLICYILRGIDAMAIIFSFYQIYEFIPCFCNYDVIANQFFIPMSIVRLIYNIIVALIIEVSLSIHLLRAKYLEYYIISSGS